MPTYEQFISDLIEEIKSEYKVIEIDNESHGIIIHLVCNCSVYLARGCLEDAYIRLRKFNGPARTNEYYKNFVIYKIKQKIDRDLVTLFKKERI